MLTVLRTKQTFYQVKCSFWSATHRCHAAEQVRPGIIAEAARLQQLLFDHVVEAELPHGDEHGSAVARFNR